MTTEIGVITLHCPFCGAFPEIFTHLNIDYATHKIDDCPLSHDCMTLEQWNTRKEPGEATKSEPKTVIPQCCECTAGNEICKKGRGERNCEILLEIEQEFMKFNKNIQAVREVK